MAVKMQAIKMNGGNFFNLLRLITNLYHLMTVGTTPSCAKVSPFCATDNLPIIRTYRLRAAQCTSGSITGATWSSPLLRFEEYKIREHTRRTLEQDGLPSVARNGKNRSSFA
jgi:hypothetical protein